MPGQQHSQPDFVGSRVYVYFGITCHQHFWQNDWGLLRATAVTQGWNGERIRVNKQSSLWGRKFSHCSCRDSNSQPFDESGALINRLSQPPWRFYMKIDNGSPNAHIHLFSSQTSQTTGNLNWKANKELCTALTWYPLENFHWSVANGHPFLLPG